MCVASYTRRKLNKKLRAAAYAFYVSWFLHDVRKTRIDNLFASNIQIIDQILRRHLCSPASLNSNLRLYPLKLLCRPAGAFLTRSAQFR